MAIIDYLTSDRIALQAELRNKREVLDKMADLLASHNNDLNEDSIVTALINRERLGSTAMGHHVAIPHGRMEGLKAPVAAIIQLTSKIDFRESKDAGAQNVDLVAGLIVPADATSEHLQLLANLAEMFVDESFCQQLREFDNSNDMLDAIQNFQS